MQTLPQTLVLRQRQHRGDGVAAQLRQQVDQRPSLRGRARLGQPPDLLAIGLASGREEQHPLMCMGVERARDDVVAAPPRRRAPAPAAILRAKDIQRRTLDESVAGDGDHHLSRLDHALVGLVAGHVGDLGRPRHRDLRTHHQQLVPHDFEPPRPADDDLQQIVDLYRHLVELVLDLLTLQPSQALQPQLEDAACLGLGQMHTAVDNDIALVMDQRQQRFHVRRIPFPAHQLGPRRGGIRHRPDQRDHRVDVRHSNHQPDQQMPALARLRQVEPRPAQNHLLAEGDERHQRRAYPHQLRLAAVERDHVDPEGRLQLGEAEQLVQHHFRRRVALDLDDDAHAGAVALVAYVRDALDLLGTHQLGDAFLQGRLVHLERDLADDDGLAVTSDILERRPRPDQNRAAPGLERRADAGTAEDDASGREVRPRNDGHQRIDADIRVGDHRQRGVDDLARIVRRDIGCHADRNAGGAVDQQVRISRRQDLRLDFALVVVRLEIDRVAVDVVQQEHRRPGQPRLGIAHRRRAIAVHRAEITLPVDKLDPHRPGLRHAHHRVVDRGVAMRMELAHHVADRTRRLAIGLFRRKAALAHGMQDTPVHRLQSVAHIGQGTADDDRHRIGEIGGLHLLLDRHRLHVGRRVGRKRRRRRLGCVAQMKSVVGASRLGKTMPKPRSQGREPGACRPSVKLVSRVQPEAETVAANSRSQNGISSSRSLLPGASQPPDGPDGGPLRPPLPPGPPAEPPRAGPAT